MYRMSKKYVSLTYIRVEWPQNAVAKSLNIFAASENKASIHGYRRAVV